ncbi:hypothetical protein PR048_032293 [Dryococelus australis]|uniref:DDE-1 domain-containing protein n=1 Tax=Dryococelus australis TaxID=614101 RepID=A0ABQ9G1V9_9NEOP|nr:hypothetical protein PR048_032293 [Dryococelus australis]
MKQDFVKKCPALQTVLTEEEEENTLKKWIINCCNKGFPRRKSDVIISVKEFLQLNNRPNPFAHDTPGPGLTSEAVTSASNCVSEKDIRNWFEKIPDCLKDEEQFYIPKHPEILLNANETCFMLNPTNSKVLVRKGARNIYKVEQEISKISITVMFSFSASGSDDGCFSLPDGVGRSDTGWMETEVFYEYVGNVFVPILRENNIEMTVSLFVNGHKSHISCRISELCTELGVVLIALYTNATRILQPGDVAALRPIKEGWKGVLDWRREHPNEELKKDQFSPVLETVLSKHVKAETLAVENCVNSERQERSEKERAQLVVSFKDQQEVMAPSMTKKVKCYLLQTEKNKWLRLKTKKVKCYLLQTEKNKWLHLKTKKVKCYLLQTEKNKWLHLKTKKVKCYLLQTEKNKWLHLKTKKVKCYLLQTEKNKWLHLKTKKVKCYLLHTEKNKWLHLKTKKVKCYLLQTEKNKWLHLKTKKVKCYLLQTEKNKWLHLKTKKVKCYLLQTEKN